MDSQRLLWNNPPLLHLLIFLLLQSTTPSQAKKDNGINTCEIMPTYYVSFSGREVISEGECFWDYMSCTKRTKDVGCCKGRFVACCHGFHPIHNEHKPTPDDSSPSDSNQMEEIVARPTTLTTTPESPVIITTTPPATSLETTTREETTTITPQTSAVTTTQPQTDETTKESWFSSSTTNAPPRIIDCVWQFNGCIQKKFERMEKEDICYAIFEDCKMRSMGMRGPVTTDELPQPIPTKPSTSVLSTESTTKQEATTSTLDGFSSTTSSPTTVVSSGEVSTVTSEGVSITDTTVTSQSGSMIDTTVTSEGVSITDTTVTSESGSMIDTTVTSESDSMINTSTIPSTVDGTSEGSTTKPPQNLPIISTIPTTSSDLSTTEMSTVTNSETTATTSLEEMTTLTSQTTDSSTEISDSSLLTTIISVEPTTSDNTLSTTKIQETSTTTDGQTMSTNPTTSTATESLETLFFEQNLPGQLDIITTVPKFESITLSSFSDEDSAYNEIPLYSVENDVQPQVYTNTFQCVWAFNGCVRQGKPEEECRKSFRQCDNDKTL